MTSVLWSSQSLDYILISAMNFEIFEANITEGMILMKERLFDTNPLACIALFFNYLFLEFFGNGMLFIIIIYERFAMDPQKRFIDNILLSHFCFNSIIQNVIASTYMTYQLIFGTPGSLSKSYFEILKKIIEL